MALVMNLCSLTFLILAWLKLLTSAITLKTDSHSKATVKFISAKPSGQRAELQAWTVALVFLR